MTSHSFKKAMGATQAEFLRLLPNGLGSSSFTVDGKKIFFDAGQGKEVRIDLGSESKRQIALMVIPTMPVEIELSGFSDDEAAIFMKQFDRSYQRGGG
ncbi:MAG: hypothetical protein HON65_04990 [Rhodospirillales bacterium]|jgi:hypothetical protein|nr:hypothetical protein [Rhodospirillales bacterium]